jgi:hypothetical protein
VYVRRLTPGPESELSASSRDRWFFGIHSHPEVDFPSQQQQQRHRRSPEVGREARLRQLDVSVRRSAAQSSARPPPPPTTRPLVGYPLPRVLLKMRAVCLVAPRRCVRSIPGRAHL